MHALDLQPTPANVYATFSENAIGRNEDIFYFTQLLNSVSGAYSIAINGRWGSGKTFFVKQTQMAFEAFNCCVENSPLDDTQKQEVQHIWKELAQQNKIEDDLQPHICIYYDAWANDQEEDPILSLLYEISNAVSKGYKFEGERNYLNIAIEIARLFKSKNMPDPISLFQALKSKNITDGVRANKDLQARINEYFNSLLPEQGERLNIFVDELDRCNPQYAVRLLERIKHYFSNEKITFIFSTNFDQLQHTIKQYYGTGFDAHRYLDRFFDYRFELPKVDFQKFNSSIGLSLDFQFSNILAHKVIEYYDFEMREATRYWAMLRCATDIPKKQRLFEECTFALSCLVPIAIGLQIHNYSDYYKFMAGDFSKPFVDIFSSDDMKDKIKRAFFNGDVIPMNGDFPRSWNSLTDVKAFLEYVYKVIFKTLNQNSTCSISVGRIDFSSDCYDFLKQVVGRLSGYSLYKMPDEKIEQ